jgi:hypothetical protein
MRTCWSSTIGARRTTLKKGTGDARWLLFSKLMGSALALRKRTTAAPGTPSSVTELREGISALARELEVEKVLASYHVVLQMTRRARARDSYYLLEPRPTVGRVLVTPFTHEDAERATEKYLAAERALADEARAVADPPQPV